jgi:hypothetical protein
MSQSAVVSLAILKVNWDYRHRDYLEIFVPIIAECIRLSPDEYISSPTLQTDLLHRFGLRIPQNAINSILQRVKKRGYITKHDNVYRRDTQTLGSLDFARVQTEVVQKHESLVRRLKEYCKDHLNIQWSTEEAESAFQNYLAQQQSAMLAGATRQSLITPIPVSSEKMTKFAVASFISDLQRDNAEELNFLDTVIKGNMLANAIFAQDPGQVQRNFHNTEVYLDTQLLIYSLGYAGKARQAPCAELLDLLYATGANMRCFSHTCDEIRGILHACQGFIERQNIRDAYGHIIPSVEYFISQGYNSSDIELLVANLDKNLATLHIVPVDKPIYEHDLVIAEQKFTEHLKQSISYRGEMPLRHDVDSMSAIMRLRRGKNYYWVEDCRAIFVTSNHSLVRSTAQFFRSELEGGLSLRAIAPAIDELTLTNLLWLKKPTAAPDLPRKRIIADCYAAIQPSEDLWKRYNQEIEKLQQSGKVSIDDFYLLRYKLESRNALMELTLGNEQAFTQATVPEILRIVHERIQQRAQGELAAEKDLRIRAENAVASARAKEQNRIRRIHSSSVWFAKGFVCWGKWLITVLLIVGGVSTLSWVQLATHGLLFRYCLGGAQLIAALLSAYGLLFSSSIEVFLRGVETTIASFVFRKWGGIAGFSPEDLPE